MRLRTDRWTPIQIGGDYGGEPPKLDCPLSRTWFNVCLWDACKGVKARREFVRIVRYIEENACSTDPPIRLGYKDLQAEIEAAKQKRADVKARHGELGPLTTRQWRAIRALQESYRSSGSAPREVVKKAWNSLRLFQRAQVEELAERRRCTTMLVLCESDLPCIEVRQTFTNGIPFYRVYDDDKHLEIFDYWRNAMHYAKGLEKGPVRYVHAEPKHGAPT